MAASQTTPRSFNTLGGVDETANSGSGILTDMLEGTRVVGKNHAFSGTATPPADALACDHLTDSHTDTRPPAEPLDRHPLKHTSSA
ncbi:hypothetical protein SprV_0602082400 [Sparganum proliferum]